MHIVDEPIETVHLYVVREEPKRPYTLLPLLAALLCVAAIASFTVYSGQHPAYEHQTLTIPAQLLPPQTFTAAQPIIPTGIKNYPATTAQGTLTITNGSVIAQILPAGFTTVSNTGISVVTDRAVFVPAGSANGYSVAYVSAHALVRGKAGNITAYAINSVEGSSVYIRNVTPFHGGSDAYSVKFVTALDRQTALAKARQHLAVLSAGLHYPCVERITRSVKVTWLCQFLIYHVPSYMHVTSVKIVGKNLLLDVWFVARPIRIWVK